jgi:ketosteroid isomerase-like protein
MRGGGQNQAPWSRSSVDSQSRIATKAAVKATRRVAEVGQLLLDHGAHPLMVSGRLVVDGMVDVREAETRGEVAAAAEAGLRHQDVQLVEDVQQPLSGETDRSIYYSKELVMPTRTTREVLDQYREAFRRHDPSLLDDLVADDCVIEDTSPAPDGARREGGAACLARWSELAGNPALRFTPEVEEIHGDLAVAPWALQWGEGEDDRVRGVNLIRVREGRIVEARGYVKA